MSTMTTTAFPVRSTPRPAPRLDLFVCPQCKASLRFMENASQLECTGCTRVYACENGIPCFAPTDEFYDEYAEEHCLFTLSPRGAKGMILRFLPFWSHREWRFWDTAIPQCERLLDIGSGRGREIFASRAKETVGYDVSVHCIRDCAKHYEVAAQGSLPGLPFPDRSFDAVVSSHVIGHIAHEDKDALAAEMARVLRPGGRAIHIIETDSNHPMIQAAKKDAAAYQKWFIDQDGHIGLELVDDVVRRFEKQGFRVRTLRLVGAVTPSLQHFRKYLDHPEFAKAPGAARLRTLSRAARTNPLVNVSYEIVMGAFHRTIEQWFGKPSNASFMMVSFELPK